MVALHNKTLAVETGVFCNNHCIFCYQKGYRHLPEYQKLVSKEEIISRMQWGIANGFDEVSLTGGEPSIRPDFLELVQAAREMGYRRVALTTNGWRLADPEFFAKAVQAGLTSLGVSIHGPDAETHDKAVNHAGAFARAVRTVFNAVKTHGTNKPLRINTFSVVHRGNVEQLNQMAEVFYALGVRLMVFQPAILSKSNFAEASVTRVELDRIVFAIRSVAMLAMDHGFRVKLFNLPPCLFGDVLSGLDLVSYERATFKEHDEDAAGDLSAGEEVGFVRLPACERCALKRSCPGLHVTLMPQEDMASHFEEAIAFISPHSHDQLWLPGTDLMRGAAIARVVRKARLAGFSDTKLTVGGSSVAARATFMAAKQGGATGIVLVHHGQDSNSSDRILCHQGNDLHLIKAIEDLATVPVDSMTISLLTSADDAAIEFLRRPELQDFFKQNDVALYLRATWRSGDGGNLKIKQLKLFLNRVLKLESGPAKIVLVAPSPRLWEATLALPYISMSTLGKVRFDLTPTVLPTAFRDHRYSVLNWSLPRLGGMVLDDFTQEPLRIRPLIARSIRTRPITVQALANASREYGAKLGLSSGQPPRPDAQGANPKA